MTHQAIGEALNNPVVRVLGLSGLKGVGSYGFEALLDKFHLGEGSRFRGPTFTVSPDSIELVFGSFIPVIFDALLQSFATSPFSINELYATYFVSAATSTLGMLDYVNNQYIGKSINKVTNYVEFIRSRITTKNKTIT